MTNAIHDRLAYIFKGLSFLFIIGFAPVHASAQESSISDSGFHELTGPCLNNAPFSGAATGVSRNGAVIVGILQVEAEEHGFVWTKNLGFADIGMIHAGSEANAVSPDGIIVAGRYTDDGQTGNKTAYNGVFRWSKKSGFQDLGKLLSSYVSVTGVSNTGTVVGWFRDSSNTPHGFVWPSSLNCIDLGPYYFPDAISSNGRLVLGLASGPASQTDSEFSWTLDGGLKGTVAISAQILGVSDDLAVLVGWTGNVTRGIMIFRWTPSGGIREIASQPNNSAFGFVSVALDGSTVIGDYKDPTGCRHAYYESLTSR